MLGHDDPLQVRGVGTVLMACQPLLQHTPGFRGQEDPAPLPGSVHRHVALEGGVGSRRGTTYPTGVRPLPCVGPLVHTQGRLVGTGVLAQLALEIRQLTFTESVAPP